MFIGGKSDWGVYQTPGRRGEHAEERVHPDAGFSLGGWSRPLDAAGAAGEGERAAVEFPARRICECERQALIFYLATTNCEPKRVKDHMQSRRIQRSDRRGRGSVCA